VGVVQEVGGIGGDEDGFRGVELEHGA